MKKLFSTIFATLLSLSLILTGFTFTVQADDLITETEKISCNATLDDNFADNRVLVVLTREASLEFNTYTANSFASLGCTKVTDLSTATGAMARTAMEQATAMLRSGESLNLAAPVEHSETISNYKQVLCLELNQSGKQNVLDTIKALMQRDDVIYAGPDYAMELRSESSLPVTPDDTFYSQQWAATTLRLPEAWSITTGDSSVMVGVIDTGINGSHEDLVGNVSLTWSRDFRTGEELEVTEVVDTDLIPGRTHGTQMAGIIGAKGDNGKGIAGVCWDVTLVSLNVFGGNGTGFASHVAMAINYSASIGIDILNLSAGWCSNAPVNRYDVALDIVIGNYPGLFVCAIDNGNTDYSSSDVVDYPSCYQLSNMIVVSASTSTDTCCGSYGSSIVNLFAPGDGIYTTCGDSNGYTTEPGTSHATAFVSGVAALMLSINPDLTPAQIKAIILDTVDVIPALEDICSSGGRLTAYTPVYVAAMMSYDQ